MLCINNNSINKSVIYLHTVKLSNSSIQHKSFVCTHFKCQTFLFDPKIGPFQVLPFWVRVVLGLLTIRGTLYYPKLQYYKSLTIRLFNVKSRTLIGGVLPLYRDAVSVILQLQLNGLFQVFVSCGANWFLMKQHQLTQEKKTLFLFALAEKKKDQPAKNMEQCKVSTTTSQWRADGKMAIEQHQPTQ